MSYEYILVERPAERVATITLNHPPRLNAINGQMLRELDRAVRRIERDDEVRAWLLTGAPRLDGRPCFSAGVDLKAVNEGVRLDRHLGPRVTNTIDDMLKPSIAVLDGIASTGAIELALACDFRLVGAHAAISDWHLKHLGSGVGSWGSPARWLSLVGPSVTKEMILTAKVMNADEAVATGFATARYPSEELYGQALDMAGTMAGMNPDGVSQALAHIQQSGARERDHSLTLATQVRHWFGSTETFGERARKVMAERGNRQGAQKPESD